MRACDKVDEAMLQPFLRLFNNLSQVEAGAILHNCDQVANGPTASTLVLRFVVLLLQPQI